jgi:hypothetical protein
MSDFPKTQREMVRAGYKRISSSVCKRCGATIEWWQTVNGKKIPMDPAGTDYAPVETHWNTCPNAKEFKGGADAQSSAEPAPANMTPAPGSLEAIARDIEVLRRKYNARVIVLVDDFGTTARWRGGLPGEDLRHDLISAGNFVRAEIAKGDATL